MKVEQLISLLQQFPSDMEVVALDDSQPMIVGGVTGVEVPESTGVVCIIYAPDEGLEDKWP